MWTAIISAIAAATVTIISTAALERRRKREQEARLKKENMLKEQCADPEKAPNGK